MQFKLIKQSLNPYKSEFLIVVQFKALLYLHLDTDMIYKNEMLWFYLSFFSMTRSYELRGSEVVVVVFGAVLLVLLLGGRSIQ